MSALPNLGEPYDRPLLDGIHFPGICKVNVDKAHNVIEVVKANNDDGGSTVPRGKEPHEVFVECNIITLTHLQELDAFFKAFGSKMGAEQRPVVMTHPFMELYNISSLLIREYPIQSPVSNGIKFTVKLVQYVKQPKPTKVSKTKKQPKLGKVLPPAAPGDPQP